MEIVLLMIKRARFGGVCCDDETRTLFISCWFSLSIGSFVRMQPLFSASARFLHSLYCVAFKVRAHLPYLSVCRQFRAQCPCDTSSSSCCWRCCLPAGCGVAAAFTRPRGAWTDRLRGRWWAMRCFFGTYRVGGHQMRFLDSLFQWRTHLMGYCIIIERDLSSVENTIIIYNSTRSTLITGLSRCIGSVELSDIKLPVCLCARAICGRHWLMMWCDRVHTIRSRKPVSV